MSTWKIRLALAIIKRLSAYVDARREQERLAKEAALKARIEQVATGERYFEPEELTFASKVYCQCGHGLAYPKASTHTGSWYCSAVLLGKYDLGQHDGPLPFTFYEIKSEDQPSANGMTTRGNPIPPRPDREVPASSKPDA